MSANRQQTLVSLIALVSALGLASGRASAQVQPSNEELMKQIKMLEERLRSVEGQLQRQQSTPPPAGT